MNVGVSVVNVFVRRVVVAAFVLTCVSVSPQLSIAQAVQDDLTTMTSEQRRAYLEEYLRKLSPMPAEVPVPAPTPAVISPAAEVPAKPVTPTQPAPLAMPAQQPQTPPGFVSIEKELVCSANHAAAPVSPWVRLRDETGLTEGTEWVLRSQVASTGRFGALLKESDSYFLEQRCIQDPQKVARYAQVSFVDGKWMLDFGNGLIADGGVLVPTPQGFLLDQKGALMEFRLGSPARMVRVPAGYRLAELQHSDVSDSRVVLLLSTGLLKSSFNWADFKDLFRFRGKAEEVGAADSRHPAILYHLDNGKVWSVDLEAADLQASLKGFCSSKVWLDGLSCGVVSDRQWLLLGDGAQKSASYFWRLGWVKSAAGFDLWFFDPARAELVLSQSDGKQARRQVLPKAVHGVWWRVDGARPLIMMDAGR